MRYKPPPGRLDYVPGDVAARDFERVDGSSPWRQWMTMSEAARRARARAELTSAGGDGSGDDGFEPTIVGVLLAEVGGGITEANETFLALTGVAPRDLPVSWEAVTSAESPVPEASRMEALLRNGGALSWETEIAARSGARIPVLVVAARPTENGRQYVGFVLDLSRAKHLEQALWRSEERFRAIYTHGSVMCFTVVRDGTIVAVNHSGAERLGYRDEELVGVSVFALLHQQDRPVLRELLDTESRQTGLETSCDLRFLRKDGPVVWARGFPRSLPAADGQVLFLLAGKDLAEDSESEERLLAYQMRLRTLTLESALAEERQRRRIALGLHDDVGHSLALARMKLASFVQRDGGERGPELGEVRGLIDQAIGYTRALTFDLSPPTLYELGLEPALESVGERLAESSGVRFVFASDGVVKLLSPEATILLYRSVSELLRNVVKHARARTMWVEVANVQNRIEVTVADDGEGFDPTELTERRGRDRGYGLFSIREQLRAIGGHLDVDTAPGRGTRCSLRVLLESPAV
ncbi:MAG: PAS domain-containing sensor histidine kinase [Gemmatimonadales bacterium]